ncbi:MAG: DMT family transporter [Candidatus Bathyarchaeota archaeon]
MQDRTRKLALIEGVLAGSLFGTAAIFIRILQNTGLDSFYIAFWRLIIACFALGALFCFIRRSQDFNVIRKNIKEYSVLSFFLALHFIFFISAVNDTSILNATVLVNTTPIFSILVSSLLFREKPYGLAILALFLSFFGILVITLAETVSVNTNIVGRTPTLRGDLEAVLAALVEAFYLNYGRKIRKRTNTVSTMFPIYVVTALLVGALSIAFRANVLNPPINLGVLVPLIGLGILPTAAAHTLYFSSLSNLKSFETATMALLEPIGATILGMIIFQEIPAPFFILGACLILLGVFFVVKGGNLESDKTNKKSANRY